MKILNTDLLIHQTVLIQFFKMLLSQDSGKCNFTNRQNCRGVEESQSHWLWSLLIHIYGHFGTPTLNLIEHTILSTFEVIDNRASTWWAPTSLKNLEYEENLAYSMMNNMPLVQDQNIICDARAPNKMAKNVVPLPIFLLSTLHHTIVLLFHLKALPNGPTD